MHCELVDQLEDSILGTLEFMWLKKTIQPEAVFQHSKPAKPVRFTGACNVRSLTIQTRTTHTHTQTDTHACTHARTVAHTVRGTNHTRGDTG